LKNFLKSFSSAFALAMYYYYTTNNKLKKLRCQAQLLKIPILNEL